MKILVLSDSHGSFSSVCQAYIKENPNAVIFLGDGQNDIKELSLTYSSAAVYAVCGNCDFFSDYRNTAEAVLDGVRVFACHGHTFGVKQNTDRLLCEALSRNADIALYGHTHIPQLDFECDITLLNPGSIGYGESYAVIETHDGKYDCYIKRL